MAYREMYEQYKRAEIKKNGLAVVYIRAIDKPKEKTENA